MHRKTKKDSDDGNDGRDDESAAMGSNKTNRETKHPALIVVKMIIKAFRALVPRLSAAMGKGDCGRVAVVGGCQVSALAI